MPHYFIRKWVCRPYCCLRVMLVSYAVVVYIQGEHKVFAWLQTFIARKHLTLAGYATVTQQQTHDIKF
jgi:hypothetical protein